MVCVFDTPVGDIATLLTIISVIVTSWSHDALFGSYSATSRIVMTVSHPCLPLCTSYLEPLSTRGILLLFPIVNLYAFDWVDDHRK